LAIFVEQAPNAITVEMNIVVMSLMVVIGGF